MFKNNFFREKHSSAFKLFSLANRFTNEVEPIFWPSGKIYGFGNSPARQQGDNNGAEPFQKVIHGKNLFENVLKEFDAKKDTELNLFKLIINVGRDKTM